MYKRQLKNIITRGPHPSHRPHTVLLGFRDVYLTEPDYRTRGPYALSIDWFATDDEPVLDRLAYLRGTSPLGLFALEHSGLWQQRAPLRQGTENYAKDVLAPRLAGASRSAVRGAVDRVFAEERKRPAAVNQAQLEAEAQIELFHFDFKAQLDRSFLPHIVRMCKENDIRLVVVRMPTRKMAQVREESVELPEWARISLPAYTEDLYRWLDDEEVVLLDFEREYEPPLAHFAAGDHIGPGDPQREFTKRVTERLRKLAD